MFQPVQYAFGVFRLDSSERALYRQDQLVSLTPKALETLLFLVQRRGHIVDKDELMRAVWPDTFVEEVSLARNISVLRKILSDGVDGRAFIETVPKRGYRFVATVAVSPNGNATQPDAGVAPPAVSPRASVEIEPPALTSAVQARSSTSARTWILLGCFAALSLASIAALDFMPRDAVPRVTSAVQMTSFGRASDPLAVSGDRLYLGIRTGGARQIAQISALPESPTTEEPLILPTGLSNPHIFDISPDGSQLLLGSESSAADDLPFWVVKSAGGAPKRLGDLSGSGAAWSPDGNRIAYTRGSGVYVANTDGSEPRKLTDVSAFAFWPRWSPDGRVIRFSAEDANQEAASIWEVPSAGGSSHLLFPNLRNADDRWGNGPAHGSWSRDGKYFFFLVTRHSSKESAVSVWAVRDSADFLGRPHVPKQIYVSPLTLSPPVASRDGKRLFLTAYQEDRELMKYDARQRRFVSWLGGASVSAVNYSPDRQWVAYVSFTDGVLWRARPDGTGRLRLVDFPSRTFSPVFSPDGNRIAFYDAQVVHGSRIFLVPRDGGAPVPVTTGDDTSASWFPDGNAILYRHRLAVGSKANDPPGLYRLDLQTGKKELLPGSEGKTDPVLSPDGLSAIAISEDLRRLSLFDLGTQQWRELARGSFLRTPCWSRDSRYIYFQDYYQGSEQPIYRVRLSDGVIEKVATSAQFQRSDVFHGYVFQGLAPDDSPIVSLVRNKSDVFALELEPPK